MSWIKLVIYKFFNLLEVPLRTRQSKLLLKRKSYFFNDFARVFPNVDDVIIKVVWEEIQNEAIVENFKPFVNDDIGHVLGLVDEDLDDFVLKILKKLNLYIPTPAETRNMPSINTVEDLVLFIGKVNNINSSKTNSNIDE